MLLSVVCTAELQCSGAAGMQGPVRKRGVTDSLTAVREEGETSDRCVSIFSSSKSQPVQIFVQSCVAGSPGVEIRVC